MNPRAQWLSLLISMIVLGLLLTLDAYQDYQSIHAREVARLIRQTEIVDRNLSRSLQRTHDALAILSREVQQSLRLSPGERPDLKLQRFVSSMSAVRTVVILNADAEVVDSNKLELIGRSFRDSPRYKSIRDNSDPAILYVTAPFDTPLGNYAMSLGKVVADGKGGFGGYVLAILDPDYFGTLLSSLVYAPDMRLGVVHADGLVVYRVPDEERVVGQDLSKVPGAVFPKHLAEGKHQTFHESRAAAFSDIRYTSYLSVRPESTLADNALHVFASRDRSAIFSVWTKDLYHTILLFVVIGLAASFGLAVYQRRQQAVLRLEALREAERMYAEAQVRKLNEELEGRVRERTEELSKANAELGYLSHHDVLTGMHNRLSAGEYLRTEFMRMKRSGSAYAVLVLDIDYFKNVNDTYGHAAGDRALRCVADAVKNAVRESDFVARYGGEEFLVILPDADPAGSLLAAEKLRAAVESARCPETCMVTVSVGVALSTPGDRDEDVAVGLADARLYSAKAAGRNRVVADGNGLKAWTA